MRTFEKLKIRIKKDLGMELENFNRQYVGHWQRSRGAWVWTAYLKNNIHTIGSTESATALLKSKKPLLYLEATGGQLAEIMSDVD